MPPRVFLVERNVGLPFIVPSTASVRYLVYANHVPHHGVFWARTRIGRGYSSDHNIIRYFDLIRGQVVYKSERPCIGGCSTFVLKPRRLRRLGAAASRVPAYYYVI